MPTYEELLYDSSSDEEDGEEALMEKHGGRSSRGRAWIKEGEKDEPLDFLDTGATKRVLGVYMGCWMCTWGAGCVHGVLDVCMGCWTCAWGAGCVHGVLGVYMGCWTCAWGAGCVHGVSCSTGCNAVWTSFKRGHSVLLVQSLLLLFLTQGLIRTLPSCCRGSALLRTSQLLVMAD